ncbi:hypothetical protein L195_g015999 [Trifolium pratense]|uniref:Uncharacterized protein n=1 Tax=Trifolium pratense TaxID=57577 RepID=A0A2K3MQ13_TRIPR|nr:hypothetical protein L195_g015999 [Trifolium pratense]
MVMSLWDAATDPNKRCRGLMDLEEEEESLWQPQWCQGRRKDFSHYDS